jgi:hypothetical protein
MRKTEEKNTTDILSDYLNYSKNDTCNLYDELQTNLENFFSNEDEISAEEIYLITNHKNGGQL